MAATHIASQQATGRGAGRARQTVTPAGGSSRLRIGPLFWMTVLAAFIVTVGILPAAGDPASAPASAGAAITVRVAPSDTLWTIASQHRLPGLSTAQMVRVIRDANPQSGTLTAGAVLQIPAEAMDGTAYAQVSGVGTAR